MEEKEFDLKNIKILDEDGKEGTYEIVGYVNIDEGDFLAYTDNKKNEHGKINFYVNSIVQDENDSTILDEATDKETAKVLEKLKEKI